MAESSYSASSDSPPPVSGTTETRRNRDSIKKGFSDIMKFADVNFTRARQFVTEKAGKAEGVTGFDEEFESLCSKMDQIKLVTERMLAQVEILIQPNPNVRLEDWARTKLDRPKPTRLNSHSLLGNELTRASEAFGKETQYGMYLFNCGQVSAKMGESQRRFEEKILTDVITPLKAFLEIDIKSIQRERKILNVKRLDMDARRASHRKAQGDEKLASKEMALRDAQGEYDQQLTKVRNSLKRVVETHVNNMGYLKSFMAAQRDFHAECQAYLGEIDGEGGAGSLVPQSLSGSLGGKGEEQGGKFMVGDQEFDREESRRARMLYDYDAVNEDELSINSGTLLIVTPIPGDAEYLMAEYKGKMGKVPSTYLEYL